MNELPRLLTIVAASYNHAAFLPELFASITETLPETRARLELLIIDDGSTDDSVALVKRYAFPADLRVRSVTKANAGLVDSLHRGLAMTETPYMAVIASDDFYRSDALDEVMRRLAATDVKDLCWVCQARFWRDGPAEQVYPAGTARLLALTGEDREEALSVSFPKPLLLQSTIFGTDLLRRAAAWSDGVRLDDWPTYIRIARADRTSPVAMRFVGDVELCWYRQHAESEHRQSERLLAMCLEVVTKVVAPHWQRRSMANVYGDFALIFLHQRRPLRAAHLYGMALTALPTFAVAVQPWVRMARSARKRLAAMVLGIL